jgi:hypothetical protein
MEQKSYRENVRKNAVKDLIGMGVIFGKDPQAASSTETELCFEAVKAIGAHPKHAYYGAHSAAYNYFNKVWEKMQK